MKMTTKKSIRFAALLFSTLFLQGCATMDESDCLTANWNEIGFRDGSRGLAISRMDSRASDCRKHNIELDRNSYLSGHNQGLVQFCLPSNGYQMGSDEEQYSYICPANLEMPFLTEYVKGLNMALDLANNEIRELDSDIREAELDLREATTEEQKETINKRIGYLERTKNNRDKEEQSMRAWLSTAIDRL